MFLLETTRNFLDTFEYGKFLITGDTAKSLENEYLLRDILVFLG